MLDRAAPDTPQAWLQRAHSDLNLCRVALETPDIYREDACFHAQQCVEKAIKALLIHLSIDFPHTHVLERLLDLLITSGIQLPSEVDESFTLTQYAVQTRYPGVWEPTTDQEAQAAFAKLD